MTSKKNVADLAQIAASVTNEGEMKEFLEGILTPQELDDIAQRIQILKLLTRGFSQREVAKKLGVSIGTISRGARVLKYGKNNFDKLLAND